MTYSLGLNSYPSPKSEPLLVSFPLCAFTFPKCCINSTLRVCVCVCVCVYAQLLIHVRLCFFLLLINLFFGG